MIGSLLFGTVGATIVCLAITLWAAREHAAQESLRTMERRLLVYDLWGTTVDLLTPYQRWCLKLRSYAHSLVSRA